MNTEVMYDILDGIWPVRRRPEIRTLEKRKLEALALSDQDFEKLKNKIEILIEDTDPKRLPQLVSLFVAPASSVKPVVIDAVPVFTEEDLPVNEAEEVFKEIFAAWPEFDIPQSEKLAKEAFLAVAKRKSLEDVKRACSLYIKEMNDPAKASVRVLGMKRFLSEDVLEDWIDRKVVSHYDRALFDAAYSWYPDFPNKSAPATISDSLGFYRRFIVGEDAIRFLAAVQAYRDERRAEVKHLENMGDLDGDRFTKRFVSFIRIWEQQNNRDDLARLLEKPFIEALRKNGVKYGAVYPAEMFMSALKWFCERHKKVSQIVTSMFEHICECLTDGNNCDNLVEKVVVDYSIVSETIAGALELSKKKNHFVKVVDDEDEE